MFPGKGDTRLKERTSESAVQVPMTALPLFRNSFQKISKRHFVLRFNAYSESFTAFANDVQNNKYDSDSFPVGVYSKKFMYDPSR